MPLPFDTSTRMASIPMPATVVAIWVHFGLSRRVSPILSMLGAAAVRLGKAPAALAITRSRAAVRDELPQLVRNPRVGLERNIHSSGVRGRLAPRAKVDRDVKWAAVFDAACPFTVGAFGMRSTVKNMASTRRYVMRDMARSS